MGGVVNITVAAWTAGFQWWRSGNITRTQYVSEYMLVLALCLVKIELSFLVLNVRITIEDFCVLYTFLCTVYVFSSK